MADYDPNDSGDYPDNSPTIGDDKNSWYKKVWNSASNAGSQYMNNRLNNSPYGGLIGNTSSNTFSSNPSAAPAIASGGTQSPNPLIGLPAQSGAGTNGNVQANTTQISDPVWLHFQQNYTQPNDTSNDTYKEDPKRPGQRTQSDVGELKSFL